MPEGLLVPHPVLIVTYKPKVYYVCLHMKYKIISHTYD